MTIVAAVAAAVASAVAAVTKSSILIIIVAIYNGSALSLAQLRRIDYLLKFIGYHIKGYCYYSE